MSGLGPQRDLEEAAALERRRRRELLRRSRIFNARLRTIGAQHGERAQMQLLEARLKLLMKEITKITEYLELEVASEDHPVLSPAKAGSPREGDTGTCSIDKDALDAQVKERKLQEAAEKARDERFAHQMKKNDKLMCLLEERQKNEIKDMNRALIEFQKNFQRPETRREFDLNDPQALKKDRPARVSDSDPQCTISGMQKFMGEDLNYDQRMKFQKEQLREWSLQQQKDWKNALADQKLADDLYDKFRVELDRKIMEQQRKEEESRRTVCTAIKTFNRIQAAELDHKNELEKAQKIKDDMDEITCLLRGDFLSENPDQAIGIGPLGKHHVLVDRWKGMNQEQLMAIREFQKEQVLENLRRREQERRRDAEWDRQRLQAARAQLLWDRHQQRQSRVQRQDLDVVNAELSQEQKAKKIYLKEEEYSNIPTDEYYAQFNTTTR